MMVMTGGRTWRSDRSHALCLVSIGATQIEHTFVGQKAKAKWEHICDWHMGSPHFLVVRVLFSDGCIFFCHRQWCYCSLFVGSSVKENDLLPIQSFFLLSQNGSRSSCQAGPSTFILPSLPPLLFVMLGVRMEQTSDIYPFPFALLIFHMPSLSRSLWKEKKKISIKERFFCLVFACCCSEWTRVQLDFTLPRSSFIIHRPQPTYPTHLTPHTDSRSQWQAPDSSTLISQGPIDFLHQIQSKNLSFLFFPPSNNPPLSPLGPHALNPARLVRGGHQVSSAHVSPAPSPPTHLFSWLLEEAPSVHPPEIQNNLSSSWTFGSS